MLAGFLRVNTVDVTQTLHNTGRYIDKDSDWGGALLKVDMLIVNRQDWRR